MGLSCKPFGKTKSVFEKMKVVRFIDKQDSKNKDYKPVKKKED